MAPRLVRAPRRGVLVAMVFAVALASLAARTKPFTWSADTLVVIGYGSVLTVVWSRHARAGTTPLVASPTEPWRRTSAWLVLLVSVLTLEIVSLLGHPRDDHPTLSSIINVLDRTAMSRGVVFLAWLALGVVVLTT